jgi:hypothetical protein
MQRRRCVMDNERTRAARILGQMGGGSTSPAKSEAARRNGAKGGRPKKVDENVSVLGPTLAVIKQLETEGLIQKATIGGSVALMQWSQPMYTEDLDMFCFIPSGGLLISLGPIYKRLEELGCVIDGMYVRIKGVPVQFLTPHIPIEQDAFQNTVPITVGGVTVHVLDYEYILALKVNANRRKDWTQIFQALESAAPDMNKLKTILTKHGLWERWEAKLAE